MRNRSEHSQRTRNNGSDGVKELRDGRVHGLHIVVERLGKI